MNFFTFLEKFPTEQAVISYYIQARYKRSIPSCPICNKHNRVVSERGRPRFFHCNGANCNSSFSIFKDTIFEKTTTDLRKWVYAMHLFLNGKKGISAYQLQREIKVAYNTAWRMLRQIRTAMGNVKNRSFARTIVEIDETYIGGKPRKNNKHDQADAIRGRGTSKTPVIGIIDRKNKQVYAKVALPNAAGATLTGVQILKVINQVCTGKNTIMTDQFSAYGILKNTHHKHKVVDHSKAFVVGDVHTNNIEGFWSILKRGILGIYHQVSRRHLQKYIDEFCFRYNNRDIDKSFDCLLEQSVLV